MEQIKRGCIQFSRKNVFDCQINYTNLYGDRKTIHDSCAFLHLERPDKMQEDGEGEILIDVRNEITVAYV